MAGEYATTTDVKQFNSKRTYNTTTKPTASQVTSMIAKVQAMMNARFSGVGISIPITTSATHAAFKFVNYLCAKGAAGYVEESTFMGGNRQESDHALRLLDDFESQMTKIESNPVILNSLVTGANYRFDSYEISNPDEAREDVNDEPFARGTNYW